MNRVIEAGRYRPVIDRTYTFDDVVAATRYVEAGQKTGNVVLRVGEALGPRPRTTQGLIDVAVASRDEQPLAGSGTRLARLSRLPDPADPTIEGRVSQRIFWHRELPPLDGEVVAEHFIDARSDRVPGALSHRDELWAQCHETLMAHAKARLEQELDRLGGDYAHVLDESVDSHHDALTDTAWLQGRFAYVLLKARQAG